MATVRQTALAVVSVLSTINCGGAPNDQTIRAGYDERTGDLSQLTINTAKDGKPNVFSYIEAAKFTRIEIDNNEDGKIDRWEYFGPDQKLLKVGLSRSNDGVVDSWAFQGSDGQVQKVDVSTRRDGQVNRTEFYEGGKLANAEEDTNHDGRVDKWETYAEGVLATVSFDTTGAGAPNHVIDYGRDKALR
jgi:hypothetical protein